LNKVCWFIQISFPFKPIEPIQPIELIKPLGGLRYAPCALLFSWLHYFEAKAIVRKFLLGLFEKNEHGIFEKYIDAGRELNTWKGYRSPRKVLKR
jgi:hypothetical protein